MANGTLKVQNIETSSGSGTITLGQSGETLALGASNISGFGKIGQVVMGQTSTTVSNATTSFVDTGLSASITPSSTSSKILCLVNQGNIYNNTAAGGVSVKLFRDSTEITFFAKAYAYGYQNTIMDANAPFLDSPATTSSITYKTQFKNWNGTGTASVQGNSGPSFLTLMEVLP